MNYGSWRRWVIVSGFVLITTTARSASQVSDLDESSFSPDRFTFVRIMYDSSGGSGEAFYRGDT
ncbi:MAG: hypothetical protein ACK52L_06535, partial [Pirellula sp.]